MKANYSYPLDFSWSQADLIAVMKLWNALEAAYETGVEVARFKEDYAGFKKVVPSIGEEKRLGLQFEKETGYSLYRAVKLSRELTSKRMKLEAKL